MAKRKWRSLMPIRVNGNRRSTRLVDLDEGSTWEVGAKWVDLDGGASLLRVKVWRRRDDGPDDWCNLVLDDELNLVAMATDDRESKAFESTERTLDHKQLS